MKIILREVKIEDSANIAKWRNNVKVVRHCIDKTIISEESNRIFFDEMILTGKYKQFIVERYDDEFGGIFAYQIGTTYFKDIDNKNHKCELGMFPSDDDEWNSEGQELAVRKMIDLAFSKMDMHKIYAYVYSDCEEEIELLNRCGLQKEAHFRSEILDDGNYRDILRLAIINS